jgi:hypothetical protein
VKKMVLVAILAALSACGGAPGPAGAQGPAGKDGMSEVADFYCSNTSAGLYQNVYTFTDGSVMATCNANVSSGGYSGTSLYRSSQSGASTGACSVWYGQSYLSFAFNGTTSIATDNANGTKYTLTCTKY